MRVGNEARGNEGKEIRENKGMISRRSDRGNYERKLCELRENKEMGSRIN